ncbi:MAG: inosine/xanthosine triphosphatase [Natrialbaceae archaeon]|nr:inosine/xanthosine triphosphatase [Natrialbaceae archaeon]
MHVAVGSENPVKIAAVERTLPDATVTARAVDSGVSAQPRSISETIEGARVRARRALEATTADIGCGLEGGVAEIDPLDTTALVMWAAATNGTTLHCGGGPTLPLPDAAMEDLERGRTLGESIDEIAGTNGLARAEGAIGLFTGGLTDRQQALGEAIACAFGPYVTDYYE